MRLPKIVKQLCDEHGVKLCPPSKLSLFMDPRQAWVRRKYGISSAMHDFDENSPMPSAVFINPRAFGPFRAITLHEIGHCKTKFHPNKLVREERAWRWAMKQARFTHEEYEYATFCLLMYHTKHIALY